MEFGMLGSQNSIILYVSVNTDRTGPPPHFKSIYFLISIPSNPPTWAYIYGCVHSNGDPVSRRNLLLVDGVTGVSGDPSKGSDGDGLQASPPSSADVNKWC